MEHRVAQSRWAAMTGKNVLSVCTFGAALMFAAAPFFTPFSGFDPDAYPIPQNNPPVQPAGYAFAIWGVIYVWLVISTAIGATIRRNAADWDAHRLPLLGSLLIGSVWLWVADKSPVWATVLIWIMLALAIWALIKTPKRERILLRAPVGLYAGWLTAASCVSVGLLGAGYGLARDQVLGVTLVTGDGRILRLGGRVMKVGGATAYMAGVAWALIAVAVKSVQEAPHVALLAGIGVMALGIATLWQPKPKTTGT